MFVPQTDSGDAKWAKWLAEISVISAALSRSRPIKESQPFKQLKLNVLPKIGGELQVEDTFLDKYPPDVARLVTITPHNGTKQVNSKQLDRLADSYLIQYQQLQALFEAISTRLKNKGQASVEKSSKASLANNRSIDSLMIAVTSQLLQAVQQTYQDANFHEVWTLLTNFCEDDLRFYLGTMESRSAKELHAAQATLSQIGTALLQHFAPVTPFFRGTFLSAHFYRERN